MIRHSRLNDWRQALRLHQWLKNALLFVPLAAAHKLSDPGLLLQVAVAFVCFGLCASSVYILNDLLDIKDDQQHPRKKDRPFASGRLPVRYGQIAAPLLLAASFAVSLTQLPIRFSAGLAGYYVLTLLYSLTLKRRMIVDVITLSVLYTLRIVLGALAVGITLSFWLLAFSVFLFLSLALVKRYTELFHARAERRTGKAAGRGYYPEDLEMVSALGAAAGYMSVMILALYVNDTRTAGLYQYPQVIWLACIVLLTWISRVWMLAHRGHMNEDPVIFATKDRVSLFLGAILLLIFWVAA